MDIDNYSVQEINGKEYLPFDLITTPSIGDYTEELINFGSIIQSTKIHKGIFREGHVSFRVLVRTDKFQELQDLRTKLGF